MNYFYLIFVVIVAVFPLIVGLLYLFNPPREAKYRYGYRTKYTLMNQENWDLAHEILTTSYLIIGVVCFIGVVPILINFNVNDIYNIFIIVLAIQLVLIVSPFIYTNLIVKHHTKKYHLKNENEHY